MINEQGVDIVIMLQVDHDAIIAQIASSTLDNPHQHIYVHIHVHRGSGINARIIAQFNAASERDTDEQRLARVSERSTKIRQLRLQQWL